MTRALSKNEKLKAFLEQMYGKKLSDEEIEEYKDRLTKLFGLFVQIDQRTKKGK